MNRVQRTPSAGQASVRLGQQGTEDTKGSESVQALRQLSRLPWLRRGAQLLLTIVPLAYVVGTLVSNWQVLSQYDWHPNAARMLGALCLFVLARTPLPFSSDRAFSALGYALPLRTVLRGYHISALSGYLPGGLFIGRPVFFGEHGVDVISASAGIVMEQSMLTAAGLLCSLPYLFLAGAGAVPNLWVLGVVVVPLTLIVFYPDFINRMVRWMLARAGYQDRGVNLTSRQLVTMFLLDIVHWLLAGTASYFLVTSVYAAPSRLFPILASAHNLAAVLAIVIALTPGGFGIAEGATTLLLTPFLPAPLPALMAVLTRIWLVTARVVLFALGSLLGSPALPKR
ncbi:MAG: hypothetical protein AMJ93_13500 [Anaerolineae bacterium SM23_84]|nr:MAG: hypothetical protein AMJ93_13500 [Anaerolineae bacterium SM23_84]